LFETDTAKQNRKIFSIFFNFSVRNFFKRERKFFCSACLPYWWIFPLIKEKQNAPHSCLEFSLKKFGFYSMFEAKYKNSLN
jgi:hypothetical protein